MNRWWAFPTRDTRTPRPRTGNEFYDQVMASNPKFNYPPVRRLADFSEAEIAALEQQYGCKVKR